MRDVLEEGEGGGDEVFGDRREALPSKWPGQGDRVEKGCGKGERGPGLAGL